MVDEKETSRTGGKELHKVLQDFIIFHCVASGKIIASSGELKAEFVLYQLCNGDIIIEATTDSRIGVLMEGRSMWSSESIRNFTLEGQSEMGLSFRVETAKTAIPMSQGGWAKWLFAIPPQEHLILRHGKSTLDRSQSFVFALTNVLEKRNFLLEGDDYSISFRGDLQSEQLPVINHMRLPALTGRLTVKLTSGDEISLESAEELADDIRYLLSVAEGHLVSNPHFKALDAQGNVVDIHLREARTGSPVFGFSLIEGGDTVSFLSCALPAFRAMSSEEKQKFKIKLEYYLSAKEHELREENLLNAFVAIEMLVSEKKLSGDRELAEISCIAMEPLKMCIRDLSNQGELTLAQKVRLENRLDGMFNRPPSLSEMIENALSNQHKLVFDDLFEGESSKSIRKLVALRGKILHDGRVKEEERDYAAQASWNLPVLLDRLTLAKLSYRGYFNDWANKQRQKKLMAHFIRE